VTGKELKAIRTALKLTQAEFSERLKVSRNTVNRMEFGGQAITPSMALLIEYVAREAGLGKIANARRGRRRLASEQTISAGASDTKGKDRNRARKNNVHRRGRTGVHKKQD
jgi:transcriptional regulator with XRE-family HTH domain